MVQPEKKFKAGGVSATIWKNEVDKDGKKYSYHSVKVEKTYKDGEDFKKTSSFKDSDLPKVALVSMKAYEWIVMKDSEDEK